MMPSYLRSITYECVVCGNRATVQLFNTFNEPMARYCRRHGEAQLREQKIHDEAMYAAQRAFLEGRVAELKGTE